MNARTFLFLQGPASPFLRLVADRLEEQGVRVRQITFCLGDAAFWWPKRGDWFRKRFEDWPAHLRDYVRRHGVTDLLMLGDGRPVHAAAAQLGIELGLRVHILEHGYLRPDWLTLEPDGMSANSRFPQRPEAIEALAAGEPPVVSGRLFHSSFLTYALYDLAYHLPNVLLGWLIHPHYRTHGAVHPLVEYSGWIGKALMSRRRQRKAMEAISAWSDEGKRPVTRFLLPLQLPGDYQIIRHAPGGDLFRIVDATIASFAQHAPNMSRLLLKVHPIDNGLSRWPERIRAAASRHGVGDRVFLADGGDTDQLIASSDGVVTVNSTVGLTALAAEKPVIALGSAIYDVAGLTYRGTLADFWNRPSAPDPHLFGAFLRGLAATTQLRGGFIGKEAIAAGATNVAARLLEPEERLPFTLRKPHGVTHFRYEGELFKPD